MLLPDYSTRQFRACPKLQCFGADLPETSTLEHRALVLFCHGPSLPTNRLNSKNLLVTQDFNLYGCAQNIGRLIHLPSVPSVLAVPRFKRKGTSEPYESIRPYAMPHHEHRARAKPYRLEPHPHTYTFCLHKKCQPPHPNSARRRSPPSPPFLQRGLPSRPPSAPVVCLLSPHMSLAPLLHLVVSCPCFQIRLSPNRRDTPETLPPKASNQRRRQSHDRSIVHCS